MYSVLLQIIVLSTICFCFFSIISRQQFQPIACTFVDIIEGLGAIRAQVKNFNISLQAKTPIFRMPRFNGLQIQVVHALG